MEWHPAILVLLICALSKWLLASDIQTQDPSLAGRPLSDAEYDYFFKTLKTSHRVTALCFLRFMYGCQNRLVQTFDLYENHGLVPEGRVCSDIAQIPSFPDFCTLTFYRCTLKKYFVKRIQCPYEITEISSTPQNTNQELENTESSSTLQETPLMSILLTTTPTAATETITTVSDTIIGTIPKHPSIISDITSMKLLLDLPTSSTPVTPDSESLVEFLTSLDAVIAGQSFPELFTTKLNTAEGSFSQHLMTDVLSLTPVPTHPSTSNAMTATPVISVSVVTESSSEPTTPEATTPSVGSVSTNPATTVAPASSPTSASPNPIITVTATEATTPSVGSVSTNPTITVATASSPTSASPSPVVTVTATETTPSVGSVSTNPATTVAPASSPTSASPNPIITVTATEATTPSVGSVSTNPTITVATASSPTSASPSPVVTVTATETTPSVGSVSTNPATTVAPASSPTSASPSPIVTVTATATETTPSVGSVSTNPATTVAPASSPTSASPNPIITVTATEATTPSVGSVSTNPTITVAPASSPTSASPSPAVTDTATSTTSCSSSPSHSSSTASKGSVLLTKPTTPKSPAHALPPARVAEWPVVPISALLGQYPLRPTSLVQLLLLRPGFGLRKSKPQTVAISSLLPFGAEPANIWQKKTMPQPPMNLPTTAKWKTFLPTKSSTVARLENPLPTTSPTAAKLETFIARLQDKRVQQLMEKMRELMAKGKAVQKGMLQSTSLQLLSALKNAKQKAVASLVPKKQLQR